MDLFATRLPTRWAAVSAGLPTTYWLLWLGTLINRLGSFVLPFLTLYLIGERGFSVSQAAAMVSLFGAGSLAAAFTGGEFADRLGRRPVLLASFLFTPVVVVALGLARSLTLIGPLTLLLGFFTDLYRPAVNAAVADLVSSEHRTRAYGYIYWAINLGAALAPVLAGFMARFDYFLLFLGDGITTLAFGVIVLWRVVETRPEEARPVAGLGARARVAQLRQDPLFLGFAVLALLVGVIYQQSYVTLPVDMQAKGFGPDQYGLAIAVNGALIVLLSLPISHAAGTWPRFPILALAGLLVGSGFGLTAFAGSLPLYALSIAIWTLGEILAATLAPALVADLSPIDRRGLYQGVFGGAWGLSFLLGPLLGGWVFQHLGPRSLWGGCFLLGFALAACYLALTRPAARRLSTESTAS